MHFKLSLEVEKPLYNPVTLAQTILVLLLRRLEDKVICRKEKPAINGEIVFYQRWLPKAVTC
jgi:hypothetical protein